MRETHKHWVHMDRDITGHTLWDLTWKPRKDRPPNTYISTPTSTTLKIWDVVNPIYGFTTYPSPHTPIHCNPEFTPSLDSDAFGG